MQYLLLIVAIVATLALCSGLFYLLAKRFFDNQQKQQMLQLKMDERRELAKVAAPIRLQAYERMALFLERISPNSLILRCYQPGMDMKLLQGVMTKNIRDEWEHNLSQQIYLSDTVWQRVCEAKTDIESIINTVAADYDKDADSREFAEMVLTVTAQKPVVELAIQILKADMQNWAY